MYCYDHQRDGDFTQINYNSKTYSIKLVNKFEIKLKKIHSQNFSLDSIFSRLIH